MTTLHAHQCIMIVRISMLMPAGVSNVPRNTVPANPTVTKSSKALCVQTCTTSPSHARHTKVSIVSFSHTHKHTQTCSISKKKSAIYGTHAAQVIKEWVIQLKQTSVPLCHYRTTQILQQACKDFHIT